MSREIRIENNSPHLGSLWIVSVVTTIAFTLTAKAQSGAASDDIHDIRGPIHIPFRWAWLVYIIAAVVLVCAAIWIYRWLKRRTVSKPKLPHEIALERLASATTLMQSGNAREFSIVLSEAVREYIEARFGEKAAHLTTEEFLHQLLKNQNSPLSPFSESLQDFLNHCDFAKFAKGSLTSDQMNSMLQSARTLVEQTRPTEKQVPAKSKNPRQPSPSK